MRELLEMLIGFVAVIGLAYLALTSWGGLRRFRRR